MARQQVRRDLKRKDYALRGLISLTAMALLLGVLYLRSSGHVGGPQTVSAVLVNAGGSLASGSDVKVRGVIVGRVTDISRDTSGGVRVRMAMVDGRLEQIPSNVVARILPATVFGTSFVDLVNHGPRDAAHLRAGATVPADRTQGTLELQQALDDIDRLVKALGPAKLGSALGSMATALDGNGARIGSMIDRLDAYLARLNPKMPLLRTDVRKLAASFEIAADIAPDLLQATEDSLVAMRTIVEERAAIAGLISGGTALVQDANAFLGSNAAALVRFLDNSAILLDVIHATRKAGITDSIMTNRLLNARFGGAIKHGFLDSITGVSLDIPPSYTRADCPRFGAARGDNCAGLGRAAVGSMLGGAK